MNQTPQVFEPYIAPSTIPPKFQPEFDRALTARLRSHQSREVPRPIGLVSGLAQKQFDKQTAIKHAFIDTARRMIGDSYANAFDLDRSMWTENERNVWTEAMVIHDELRFDAVDLYNASPDFRFGISVVNSLREITDGRQDVREAIAGVTVARGTTAPSDSGLTL